MNEHLQQILDSSKNCTCSMISASVNENFVMYGVTYYLEAGYCLWTALQWQQCAVVLVLCKAE